MSSLALPMTKLQGIVGDRLGYGRGLANGEEAWTEQKLKTINEQLDRALRWVYHEATLDPRMPPHQWSWLTPSMTVLIASGSNSTLLPEQFGGFVGKYLVVTQGASGNQYHQAKLSGGEPFIDSLYAASEQSGRPLWATDRIKPNTTPTSSNRHELYVYPRCDADYSFRGQYNLIGEALSSAAPYAYGGTMMANCFEAACLASAELYLDDLQVGAGPMWPVFQRSLAAAIARDARHQPKSLGLNTDRSDPSFRAGRRDDWWRDGQIGWLDPVTVDGEIPD